jgi:hypothetical protein
MSKYHYWTTKELLTARSLRREGMSYSDIAIALRYFLDSENIDGERVRRKLRLDGFGPQPRGRPYGPRTTSAPR